MRFAKKKTVCIYICVAIRFALETFRQYGITNNNNMYYAILAAAADVCKRNFSAITRTSRSIVVVTDIKTSEATFSRSPVS